MAPLRSPNDYLVSTAIIINNIMDVTMLTYVQFCKYRSGTVNSKSFVGKVLLRIKRKFELIYAL